MLQKRDDNKIDIHLIDDIGKKNIREVKVWKGVDSQIRGMQRIMENGSVTRRNYKPFGSKASRERKVCPKCNSLGISKRVSTHIYVCGRCGWKGEVPAKILY